MLNSFEIYKDDIIKANPLNQTLKYDYDKWQKTFKNSERELKDDLEDVNSEFTGSISRTHLIKFAEKVNKQQSENHSVQLFLACMMWGYGGDTEKNVDHRGPYRVNKIFNSEENIRNAIHDAFILISKNDIKTAFQVLSKIKGLSISFLSKFLYFASRGCEHIEYALIFDARVAYSLIRLTSKETVLMDIVNISPSINFHHFKKYIDFAHNLAKNFKCQAENVEYFLFEKANKQNAA